MTEIGIPFVISTDGSGCADNQDLILTAKSAAQYQKALHRGQEVGPRQVLDIVKKMS